MVLRAIKLERTDYESCGFTFKPKKFLLGVGIVVRAPHLENM